MARQLTDYKPKNRKGPGRKYDMKKWFNGRWTELKRGKDFQCSIPSMVHALRRYAKGIKRLEIYQEDENTLMVKAHPLKGQKDA